MPAWGLIGVVGDYCVISGHCYVPGTQGVGVILSFERQFAFFCNGKTGTTSLEALLSPMQQGEEFNFGAPGLFVAKHIPPAILRGALSGKQWDALFKFAFVRNPWDWVGSQWRYNRLGWVQRQPRWGWHRRRYLRNPVARYFCERPEAPLNASDVDFLWDYLQQYRGLPGAPGLLQSNYVCNVDGEVVLDFVGRFESLAADVGRVLERLRLQAELPRLNQTGSSAYRSLFSDAGKQRVAELWAEDIERFEYRF